MTDQEIIDLYWEREEQAIRETDKAYGHKLYSLSWRILRSEEDAEENVSDTYMKAWNTIPPQRPVYFFAYLAKICRNFALGRLDWMNAAKRKAIIVSITEEMVNCIPDPSNRLDSQEEDLGDALNRFLAMLSKESRVIFLRRYWFADSIEEIAIRYHISQSKVKTRLYRTRNQLRVFLEKEGISI